MQPHILLGGAAHGLFHHFIAAAGILQLITAGVVFQRRTDHQLVAALGQTQGVAGEHPGIFHPRQGGGAGDGGSLFYGEEGNKDAGVTAIVMIRGIPECLALTQGLDHPLDILSIYQCLVGAGTPPDLGILQHRLGIGSVDTYARAQQAEHAGIELQGQQMAGEQQHPFTGGHGGAYMLFAFHLHQGADAAVGPEPGHAGLEDGAAHALEVATQQHRLLLGA